MVFRAIAVAALLVISSILFLPMAASASPSPTTLTSPAPQTDGYFGSVAVSGNMVVVGAYGEAGYAGQAYIYNIGSAKYTMLSSPNPQPGVGLFGVSVAISGNIVVVGEDADTVGGVSYVGSAYIYNIQTKQYIMLSDPSLSPANDFFGWSVALSGNTVVVGAPNLDLGTAGNAYVFNAKTGALITTLSSPNAQVGGQFGYSVAVDGPTVVVGAVTESPSAASAYDGHAYIYDMGSGKYITLTIPNPQTNCDSAPYYDGDFGNSVSVSGNTVAVGAWTNAVDGNCDAGSAYTFNAGNGKLMSTLTSPDAQSGGYFGDSVAISGSTVAVGAYGEHDYAGSAYTFNAGNGKLMGTFTSPNALGGGETTGGYFGSSVGADGKTLAVGALGETAGGQIAAGNAYLFKVG